MKNIVDGFSDFKWSDLEMKEQVFEDYKSKYLDMYEEIGENRGDLKEKVSILEDIDFELELIHKDEIDVFYILNLLGIYKNADEKEKLKQKENINNIINGNASLRSKRELIEKFINENLMQIDDENSIDDEFDKFLDMEKMTAFKKLCEEENLKCEEVQKVVDTYLYDKRKPLNSDIVKTLNFKPKLLERKKVVPRVLEKIVKFIEMFF